MRLDKLLIIFGGVLSTSILIYILVVEQKVIDVSWPVSPGPDKISFAWVRDEVLGPRCLGCHQELAIYKNAVNEGPAIKHQVLELNRMPPDRPLTRREKSILSTWINNGMPENPIKK